jgi:hypothetical protein
MNPTSSLRFILRQATPLVAVLGMAGCVADEPAPEPDTSDRLTLEQRIDKLSSCTPTDLEVLVPWTGPAFDPETGALLEPLPEGHVEAVVNGWAIRTDEALAVRIEYATQALDDLFAREGLLAFQSVESVECDIAFSHSLWKDEASMIAFVVGEAHASAMSQASKMHHAVAGAHWVAPMRTEPPTWQEGIARYVEEARGRAAASR